MSSDALFGQLYARGPVAATLDDRAFVAAMLEVELALTRVQLNHGRVTEESLAAIAAGAASGDFDAGAIGEESAASATPVIALVRRLREAVGERHAASVHLGATSQDILDTTVMLLTRRALEPLLADAAAAAERLAELARAHRATPIAGRTLLGQALPISFALKAATWLHGIDEARSGLLAVREHELAAQAGGPVGGADPALAAALAGELGLVAPPLAWHTVRVRPARVAAALGVLAGVLAKLARDVILLAQDEVGEAREHGGEGHGGSSAMTHKHNPVAAVSALACTARVPGLVATLFATMAQEHERAAGGWQAEWGALRELLVLCGSATAWVRELLTHWSSTSSGWRRPSRRCARAGSTTAMACTRR